MGLSAAALGALLKPPVEEIGPDSYCSTNTCGKDGRIDRDQAIKRFRRDLQASRDLLNGEEMWQGCIDRDGRRARRGVEV
jgi:hypothetical protein